MPTLCFWLSEVGALAIHLQCKILLVTHMVGITPGRLMASRCLGLQNVKAVFDAAIKVVLQPPKQKKKKKKQKNCVIL